MFCIDYLMFDQGVSLLFSTYGDEKQLEETDVMRDFPVNNYIGARSLQYNLSLRGGAVLKKYAIKRNNINRVVAILNYDEEKKTYTIDIPENVTEKESPFIMSLFLKKGVRHMNSAWSMRWVRSRVIPSSRQNIGEILRANGMKTYDEHKLLLKNEGRSCQDEFYIENMENNQ